MIKQAVGKGGFNSPSDVVLVRHLLNAYLNGIGRKPLGGAGPCDNEMIDAISAYQKAALRMPWPDGRADPNGRTIRSLLALSATGGTSTASGQSGPAITYSSGVDSTNRVVSEYALKVVKRALIQARMSAAVITDTLRLPSEQATYMYRNAKVDLAKQYRMYGNNGDQVLKVYEANKDKPQADVIKLMTEKVEDLLKEGKRVSRHISTLEGYKSLNVFDIGVNSTRKAAGKTFNLEGLSKAFNDLEKEGYINHFIDETKKSNSCWHLEIVPDAKKL